MKMDYSKDLHFQCKIKWRLEDLGTLGIVGVMDSWHKKRFPPKK